MAGREEVNETGAVAVAPLSGGGEPREKLSGHRGVFVGEGRFNLKEEAEGKRKIRPTEINPTAIPGPGWIDVTGPQSGAHERYDS